MALRELEVNEFKELSLFEGPSSFMYLHFTMHKVFHMPLNDYLIGKFENWLLICFEKDKNLDFLTGISGIVGFLISHKSYFSDHFISNIIDRYIHRVEETMNYDSQTETVYWNHIKEFDGQAGLSHGVGGYLFTLSSIFSYTKDEKILKMIIASYNYIKSMNLNSKDGFAYFNRKKNSLVTSGWTHGASGTIYALLKAYSCVQKNFLPGIEQMILDTYKYILKESFTKNYSLATGVCGNLFALKYGYQFVEQLDRSLAKSAIIKIEKMTLGDVFNSTDFTKTFLHSSLFTGISGVPLTFLYLFDDNFEIFNFLNLE